MATKKTPTPSGKASAGTTKPKTPSARAKKPAGAKSEPVILDPPAKKTPASAKPAVIIDAKAEDVTKSKPVKRAEVPKAKAEPKAKPEPSQKPADGPKPVPARPQASNNTRAFAGFLAGGAVAALIGYFAAGYIDPPQIAPDNRAEIAALTADYNEKIKVLEGQISKIETAPSSDSDPDLEALKLALEQQATQLEHTEARLNNALTDLEALREQQNQTLAEGLVVAGGDVSAATAALIKQFSAEIADLKARIEAQDIDSEALSNRLDEVAAIASEKLAEAQATVEEISKDIATSAKSVDLTLATERLKAAVESGKSYGALLSQIATETGAEIPAALSKSAATGVATLEQLRKNFPEAARRALKTSLQTEAGSGLTDKIGAYLKAQIGARSLEEREGDDPDAILSRVEGALSRGELAAAVEQAKQLPASGLAEMKNWLLDAETRLNAQQALKELSTAIDGSE